MRWRISSFRAICDELRGQVSAAKTPSFQVVRLEQDEAREGDRRRIAAGWVLDRRETCDTSGEGSF